MARATIGLDIGTSAVRAAEVRGKEPPTLTRFAQLTLPPGAVTGGEVGDPDAVASVLRDLWRRGEFRGKRVAVAVANQNVIVRPVELPKMEESELRDALKYQVQDYIPIAIEDALLDFLLLDEFVNEEGAPMMRVLTVAAQRDMVHGFVRVVQQAGLEPVAVDLSPLAAIRALVDPIGSILVEREAEAVVDVGGDVTNVVVHERGSPRFVRILQAGGNDITDALQSELSLSREDAEARKIAVGLRAEGASVDPGAPSVIERRAAAFIDDVRRSLEYYQSQADAAPVARVVLTGGGARLPRLGERLASALRLPVEEGNPLARLKVGEIGLSPEQLEQVSAVAAVAVGLAMEA